MRNPHQRLFRARILRVLFGFLLIYIDTALAEVVTSTTQAQKSAESAVTVKPTPDDGLWVEVENLNVLPGDITGVYYLVPYRNRRSNWGHTGSIGYSSFSPIHYEPNFVATDFSNVYSGADMPLIEFQYSYKRNMEIGSIGAEIGVGMYQNKSDSDLIDSELQLIPIRLGLNFYMDNIWFEPYVVPYVSGGAYTIMYTESVESSSFGGNTQVAPYMSIGVQAQLNWIDKEAARISYTESGIENTYLFLEGRQFMASQAAADPDFSTSFNWGAGMRVEF